MQKVEAAKHAADALSVSVVIGTLASILPAVAALMSAVWFGIRIWESDTVQKWRRRRKK